MGQNSITLNLIMYHLSQMCQFKINYIPFEAKFNYVPGC